MSRQSNDQYVGGRLMNGFDYNNQAWVVGGKYVRCGHPATVDCRCFGKVHAGEATPQPESQHASREEQHGRYLDCGPNNWDDRERE